MVYLVFYNNLQGEDEFCGVYSTRAAAQAYIDRFDKYDQASLRIEETEFYDEG